MREILVRIEDTTDKDGVYPTTTPWWWRGNCLLIGCEHNKNTQCERKLKEEPCIYELPKEVNCRFQFLAEKYLD